VEPWPPLPRVVVESSSASTTGNSASPAEGELGDAVPVADAEDVLGAEDLHLDQDLAS